MTDPQQQPDHIVLVTGGSRGIGKAIASEFAAHGHAVGLVARHQDALEAAAEEIHRKYAVPVWIYPLDVTAPGATDQLLRAVAADGVTVRYLVNNAGLWSSGPVAETDLQDLEQVVTTNVLAPLRLTKAFLPQLIASKGGILNVGSLASTLPTMTFAVYGASKAFVLSLSLAMQSELKAQEVRVCAVLPGIVHTSFTSPDDTKGLLYRLTASAPETVAFAAYRGLLSGQSTVVPGFISKVLYFGISWLPRAITHAIYAAAVTWRRQERPQ